jgi:hypothetical protein
VWCPGQNSQPNHGATAALPPSPVCASRSGNRLQQAQKLRGRYHGDAEGFAQVEEIPVARDEITRMGCHRRRQNRIVFGIAAACFAQRRGFDPTTLDPQPEESAHRIDVGKAFALQRAGDALVFVEKRGRDSGAKPAAGQSGEGAPVCAAGPKDGRTTVLVSKTTVIVALSPSAGGRAPRR